MLAFESGRVCSTSPENTAADFGTSLPFNQAEPVVYNIAEAVSPPSICAGNRNTSQQHIADRSFDCDMSRDDSRMFDCNHPKRAKGFRSMRLLDSVHSPGNYSAQVSHPSSQ